MDFTIRLEQERDYYKVENLAREAFWNRYMLGCDEHYLIHNIRRNPDFIPDLDFVAVKGTNIIGHIIYTKSYVIDDMNQRHDTITFGPISVTPELQRKGIGKALIEHSKQVAFDKGYKAIIIYGYPTNYCSCGFKSSKNFQICAPNGRYPFSLLVMEIFDGALHGISGKFHDSEVFRIDEMAAEEYDKKFPFKEKKVIYTQEEFAIASNSFIL